MAARIGRPRLRRPDFQEHKHFWLGVLGGIGVVLLVITSTLYATAGIGERSVEAEFVQAAGVKSGDTVKVAGIDVGTVSGMKLDGDRVDISMNIDPDVKLGPDAHASIKVSTLLGSRYIELVPGDGSGLPGGLIPRSNTSVPYDLADVVQVGTPKFEELDAKKLAESLNVLNRQFGDSAPMAADALDSVGELTKVINNRRGEVDTMLKNVSRVTGILSDNRNNLLQLITQGDAIGARVMQRQGMIRELLDNVAALTKQLREIGAQNNGQLGPTIQQLDTISQGLEKNRDNLDRMLEIMPVTVRQFANATGNGNYGDLYIPWLFPDNWLCFAQVVPGCK